MDNNENQVRTVETRTTYIQIRLTETEKHLIEKYAKEAEMKVSEWIRYRSMTTDFYEEGEE